MHKERNASLGKSKPVIGFSFTSGRTSTITHVNYPLGNHSLNSDQGNQQFFAYLLMAEEINSSAL